MAVKKNTLLIVAGSLLILLLIGVTILLISEKQTNKELVMEFNLDKEDLENQYTDFARQYDELKLTVSNDSLSVLLEQEQLKTQRLLEELRTVKSRNNVSSHKQNPPFFIHTNLHTFSITSLSYHTSVVFYRTNSCPSFFCIMYTLERV